MDGIKKDLLNKLSEKKYYIQTDIQNMLTNYDMSYEIKLDNIIRKFKELKDTSDVIILINELIKPEKDGTTN